jgi:hypothetical protein
VKRQEAGGGARGWPGTATQVLGCLNEEDNRLFAKSPLGIGNFSGKSKTTPFCLFDE